MNGVQIINDVMRKSLLFMLLLFANHVYLQSQSLSKDFAYNTSSPYCIIDVKDYTFDQLLNEGTNTIRRQLGVLNIPVKRFEFVIKGHIRNHHFTLNKGKHRLKNTSFRAIAYSYPSVTPKGEVIMLSGSWLSR